MKAHPEWKVLEHGPLEQVADNIYRVEGALPDMALRRHMIVVRLDDGQLVIHNGIAVDEAVRADLEALGEPTVLVVPNGYHRLDAAAYKERYPKLQVVCPRGAKKAVEDVISVDTTYDAFEDTASLTLAHLDGLAEAEGVMTVHSSDGTTLVLNDALFNQPHLPGFGGLILRLIGSSGGPRVSRIARWLVVKDKKAYRDALLELADTPDLVRVIPGHIDIIDDKPAEVLREVARTL